MRGGISSEQYWLQTTKTKKTLRIIPKTLSIIPMLILFLTLTLTQITCRYVTSSIHYCGISPWAISDPLNFTLASGDQFKGGRVLPSKVSRWRSFRGCWCEILCKIRCASCHPTNSVNALNDLRLFAVNSSSIKTNYCIGQSALTSASTPVSRVSKAFARWRLVRPPRFPRWILCVHLKVHTRSNVHFGNFSQCKEVFSENFLLSNATFAK